MKKVLILLLSIMASSMMLHAQLKINNQGKIALGDTTAVSSAQMIALTAGAGNQIGVLGVARANTESSSFGTIIGRSYGVMGVAGGGSSVYNYGVYGQLKNSAKGAGVVGTTTSSSLTFNSRHAGYFNGTVYCSSSMTATSFTTSSDMRIKKGISEINSKALTNILRLNPVQYTWDKDQYAKVTSSNREDLDEFLDDKVHYGLLAQEVRELFPDLVYGDEKEGLLSINYTELIPILIQSIQELSAQLSELQNESKRKMSTLSEKENTAILYQNSPNPFSEKTQINYCLPESVVDARLYVYDMSGNQLGEYTLNERGDGTLTISASEYHAGMYLYSLIADGKEIDTKRMILTK